MMHNLEPPVGWGAHCPDQVAYRVSKNNNSVCQVTKTKFSISSLFLALIYFFLSENDAPRNINNRGGRTSEKWRG